MVSTRRLAQFAAGLSLVEGVAAFAWLAALPTNRQMLSASRLAGLGGIFILLAAFAAILVYLQRHTGGSARLLERIGNHNHRLILSFLLLAAGSILWLAVLYKDRWPVPVGEAAFNRLLPLLCYILLVCMQAGLFLLVIGRRVDLREPGPAWRMALGLWVVFLLAWLFVSLTGLGFFQDEVGLSWGPPGTPISFAQVNLVLAASFLLVSGWRILRARLPGAFSLSLSKKDVVIFLGLWAVAVLLWSRQPMSPTHFSPPPMPPNQEVYPNSDALIFDRSSYHLLYGVGFDNQLVRRPLYVGMLALFHWIAGGNYEGTTTLQILVLGLIPPLVYLLTSQLSNRTSGLVAGGLILLRELNSIELSGEIVTSHAKLMMSDMLAMLGIAAFLYAAVKWFLEGNRDDWQPTVIGAGLGLTALVRAQALILLAPLLLFLLFSCRPLKAAWRASVFALLGLGIVLLPWLWRNWNLTGTVVLDDRGEERLLARNYSETPYSLPSPLPGETGREFSDRMKNDILTFIRTHPGDVLFFISNHFFRNMAASAVYIAPLYSTDTPLSLVHQVPFWNDWTGDLPWESRIPLIFNLALLAFGIAVAVAKDKRAGLFPLAVFLTYGLGNALVRTSGWRFILPADWILLVYYGMAISYLPSKIASFFGTGVSNPHPGERISTSKIYLPQALMLSTLVVLGASVPVVEKLNQRDGYEGLSRTVEASFARAGQPTGVDSFLDQKNAVVLSGVALYPRYIRPNARIYLGDVPKGYRYLHLWLINEGDHQVILPLQDPPEPIPHTATISVVGCQEKEYVTAFAILVHEPGGPVVLRDPQATFLCPPEESP